MNINLIMRADMPAEQTPSVDGCDNIAIDQLAQVPPSVCQFIRIDEQVVGYLSPPDLGVIVQKLRHGGTLSVSGPDAMEVATEFCWGHIDIQQFSNFISNRGIQHTRQDVQNVLQQAGLIIEASSTSQLIFNIRAKRS